MFNLGKAIEGWRKSLRKSQAIEDGDLAELEGYLRDKVEDLIRQGISEEEAFRAAESEFAQSDRLDGDFYRARTDKRGGRPPWQPPRFMPDLLWNYVKIALRRIRRQKGYSFLNIAGLALGLAAALFVALYVRFETSYDRWNAAAGRIFRLAPADFTTTPYALSGSIRSQIPEVEAVTVLKQFLFQSGDKLTITVGSRRLVGERFLAADPSFFHIFSLPFISGRPETALSHPQAAVLTESSARRMFGTADCLGRVLQVEGEGRADLNVEAVVRDLPANSHFDFDVLTSVAASPAILNWDDRNNWGSWNYTTYLLLRPGTAAAAVEPKIAACFPDQVRRNSTLLRELRLQALTDIHLKSHLRGKFKPNGDSRTILLFSAVGLLILLSAAFNFINLSTAYSLRRSREVGLRKVLGAARRLIIRQFLGEALVMTALAALAALAVFRFGFPLWSRLTGTELRLSDVAWGQVLPILTGLVVLLSLAAGAYPAFFASAFQPARTLKGENVLGSRRFPVRNVLLVFQFLISLGLVTATFVVRAQMHYLKTKDTGLDGDQIVNIRLPKDLQSRADEFKAELLGQPGIISVAASNFLPSRDASYQAFTWEGKTADDDGMLRWIGVDADFLSTYGLTVKDGRGPVAADAESGEPKFLINETAVRRLGLAKAVGTRMEIEATFGRPGRIIGVIKDFNFRSLHHPLEALAFFIAPSRIVYTFKGKADEYAPFQFLSVKLARARIPEALQDIQKYCVARIGDPAAWSFFDDEFGRMYEDEIRTSAVFGGLSLIATLIAGMGVFGLSAFLIERRRKEIGIRKVLGAGSARLLGLLSFDFVKLMLAAALLAYPIVYLAMRGWLRKFAYHVVLGPWFFVGGLAFLIFLLIATVAWHGLRMALANPSVPLRNE